MYGLYIQAICFIYLFVVDQNKLALSLTYFDWVMNVGFKSLRNGQELPA